MSVDTLRRPNAIMCGKARLAVQTETCNCQFGSLHTEHKRKQWGERGGGGANKETRGGVPGWVNQAQGVQGSPVLQEPEWQAGWSWLLVPTMH